MTDDHDHDHDHDHGEHDHDHGEHDHDHDHDGEHVDDEAEIAQAEADVARMTAALAALDDESLETGLEGMTEKARIELADQLHLPRATMHLGDALIPLVRRKLRATTPDRQLQAGFAIAERVNDTTVAALGDRSADPSKDDMLEVLPAVLEEHDPALVSALLACYAASDAPCRPVMRDLLETDERFAIGPPVEVEPPPSAGAFAPTRAGKDPESKAKREQRRAAKEAKREASAREREARTGADAKRRAAVHRSKRKTK